MFKPLLAVSLLAISSLAMAKNVDWTPYLEGMQNSCAFHGKEFHQAMGYTTEYSQEYNSDFAIGKPQKGKIPKNLQVSVINYKGTGYIAKDGERTEDIRITIGLKNATAFGQPITKITYSADPGYGGHGFDKLTVYFANNDFVKLKPQFPLIIDNKKYPIGTNAYYHIQYNESDNHESYETLVTKISKPQKDHIDTYSLATTHKNGWQKPANDVGLARLTFDTKNKSIACYQSY